MGTYTKNLKLETPSYTDNADIPALTKKNNDIIDSEMIKRANGLDYNEQTGVLQLIGNNSKVGNPIQIKNNLPVTSMSSGKELKVNNYKQLIKFSKEGKTEQKSYTGKSIIAYDNSTKIMSSNPLNGISVSIDAQGIITLNGTSTDAVSFQISKLMENVLKANNNYSFYVENLGGTQSNQFSMILYGKNGTTTTNLNSTVSTTTGKIVKTITPKEDYSSAYFWFYCVKGVTFNNLKIRLMLVEGSYTADTIGDFEPYVGAILSPNPDYPQSLENVKGIKNLANINDIKLGKTWQNVSTNSRATIIQIKINPNTTYTLNSNYIINSNLTNCRAILFNDISGMENYATKGTFNSGKYNYVSIEVLAGTTITEEMLEGIWISLVEGNEAPNIPYESNYLQLEDKTENLIGLDNKQYRVNLKKGDKIFAVNNGTTNLNLNLYTNFGDSARNDFFTIAANSQRPIIIANDSHAIAWGGTLDNNAWVVKGEKFIPYEPYKEKIINVDLKGNNLCSNKDKSVKDELLVENGKAKIYKKIKEVVLNGTEGFAKTEEGFVLVTNDWGNKNKSATLSNYFTTYTNYSEFKEAKEGAGFLYENVNNFYIKIDGATTVNEFRAKLKSLYNAGTPVKVQYELAEPKVIDLGKVDFDLIENSTLTCEEESDMQIDYLTISSNIFVQDSLDGNSNQKAPSVDAVNKAINKISNYSSEEQEIGEWFGEKHYRKVFEINMNSSETSMAVSTGINMKQLTNAYGVALHNDTIYLPLNFYNSSSGWNTFHLSGNGSTIQIQRGNDYPMTKLYITLEYTKNV